MHAAGDQVGPAVAGEVANRQGEQVRRRAREIVQRERHVAVVLEPHEALRRRVRPAVVGAHDHNVEVSVAVEIGRLRARRAGDVADPVIGERHPAGVLEPLQAVPTASGGGGVVEGVAVAVDHVGIAVAVEVGQRDPARAEVLVAGAEDSYGREVACAVVHVHVDLFPLLAHERDDVEVAVAVDVGNLRVDRARQLLQQVTFEAPPAEVLEPARLALVVAKQGDRQVEVAVAVEIARPDVGNAGHLVGHHVRREALAAVVLEQDDGAYPRVVREQHAKAGNGHVEVAVKVEVHDLHVRRAGHVGNRPLRESAGR